MKPIGDITVRELCTGDALFQELVGDLIVTIRDIATSMPKCADHLLRRIFVSTDNAAFKYDPGDEPAVEIRGLTGN